MSINYSTEDKEAMKVAFQAKSRSRLQELIDFCKISGFKKIGIANCKAVQELADKLINILKNQGFEVVSMNCKESGLDGAEISPEMAGPSCDPISQAEYLNAQKTDFNINFGLCLGHGLLFQKHSDALVTTFLVKSLDNNNNIVELLESF